jgi:hypothetical protein
VSAIAEAVPLAVFFLALGLGSIAHAKPVTIRAVGIDIKTGEKVFVETGRMDFSGDYLRSGQVDFTDGGGKVFTRQKINVHNHPAAPDYALEDLRDGHREGVTRSASGYEIFFKKDAAAPEEKIRLNIPEGEIPAVTFPGFSNFVRQNWDTLVAAKPVYFYLILPTQRDYYRFRLVKDAVTGEGDNQTVHFRIELGNFLLRIFVDVIRISFDVRLKRLVRYEGIHFIRDLPKFLGRKIRVAYVRD